MQHQTLTLAPCGAYLAARYLTRDGYRSVMHYADIPAASPELRAMDPMRDPSAISAREQALRMLESAIDPDGLQLRTVRVLSIDAWRDGDGWTWNNWHKRGTLTVRECSRLGCRTRAETRRTLAWFRENGYLSDASKGAVTLHDDGYNLEVQDRRTGEPLFAIEYGASEE